MVTLAFGTGCVRTIAGAPGGDFRSQSLAPEGGSLTATVVTAVYAHDPSGDTVIVLSDRPAEEILDSGIGDGQLLIIDLLWPPRPGQTPMDPSATNSSLRHLIVADGEAGTYAGAGFVRPTGSLGSATAGFRLADSTLRLIGATSGFADPLTPSQLTGSVTARLDPGAVQRIRAWARRVSPVNARLETAPTPG